MPGVVDNVEKDLNEPVRVIAMPGVVDNVEEGLVLLFVDVHGAHDQGTQTVQALKMGPHMLRKIGSHSHTRLENSFENFLMFLWGF